MEKSKRQRDRLLWTTADELRYIRSIGQHADENLSVLQTKKSRLLQGYLNHARDRVWPDQVNGPQCIAEAEKQLMKAKERK